MWLPVLISLSVLSADPAGPDVSALTHRLGASAVQLQQLEPLLDKTCTDRAEQLDGDGKPSHIFQETTRTIWSKGVASKAIRSATENGQDVTAREQEKLGEAEQHPSDGVRERGNYGGINFTNPFRPELQPLYRYSVLPSKPGDGERVRIGFEPKEPTSSLNKGEALVEPEGALVSISAEPSDYPTFVKYVRFHARYGETSFGPVQTDFSVDGAGGFLFVQKHYREQTHCGEFSASASVSRR